MNQLPLGVVKYLTKYSFPHWKLEHKAQNKIENAIIIPALSEFAYIKRLLASLMKNDKKYFDRTAVIFVINNYEDSEDDIKNDNQNSMMYLRKIIQHRPDDSLSKEIINSGLSVCLIDASSSGFEMPKKIGGVGFARKIGMDNALKLFNYNSKNKKILISLDADCEVDSNYLSQIIIEFNQKNLFAATVNFKHNVDEDIHTKPAIICYEIFLRYYVLGLKYANSPYAFHTIGSTIVCDFESYFKIEGMNKQKAAEDFYFLEKLAKNFKVEKIASTTVYPSSRNSLRVPFGTGQRIQRFLTNPQNEYLLYNPISFDLLKRWLFSFNSREYKSSQEYLSASKQIHKELFNFLVNQNFSSSFNRIFANSKNEAQLAKQKQKWFDGFRTLKLIHYLRDKAFPQINMFQAADILFEMMEVKTEKYWKNEAIPPIETQLKCLELLRNLT